MFSLTAAPSACAGFQGCRSPVWWSVREGGLFILPQKLRCASLWSIVRFFCCRMFLIEKSKHDGLASIQHRLRLGSDQMLIKQKH